MSSTDNVMLSHEAPSVPMVLGAFWAFTVAINTLRAALMGSGNLIAAFERRALVAFFGMAISWGMALLLESFKRSKPIIRLVALIGISLPSALLFSAISLSVFYRILPLPDSSGTFDAPPFVPALVDGTTNWTFAFAAWGFLILSLGSMAENRAADQRAAAYLEAARDAEIRALRYQINPHFLFNVLNSLSGLIRRQQTRDAEALIGEMGRLLRYNLTTNPTADVPLGDEIDMHMRYLDIERRRFPDRMRTEVAVEDTAALAMVPALILQPLIENAVKHGVGGTRAPVTVRISANIEAGGLLRIVVEDDAPGDGAAIQGLGIGLENVRQRLDARFGAAAHFTAERPAWGGFRVILRLPAVRSRP
jgi:signal transduction histidine kinase